MSRATGLILQFVRCNAAPRTGEWQRFLEDVLLPEQRAVDGVRAATLFALRVQPAPWMPSVGFTHAILIEVAGGLAETLERLRAREAALREAGRIDRNHCLMVEDALRAHGRHANKPLPGPELHGHILAYVHCNDPRVEREWDAWNDDVHMPDMLDSGAFTGVSRWVREPRVVRGTNFLTLYDVGPHGVDVAVEKSAAVMPGLVASGRKHESHIGGLTVTLVRP
ncbi:MAG: hypothetical protein IPK00_22875 [Deltaproteobacteria bacterium]|nr:hypothetical protein [Deltaproteobacteria bacterium]